MLVTVLIVAITTSALLAGAAWGRLSDRVEGTLIACAGGALIVAVVSELIEPAAESLALPWLAFWVLAGAVAFSGLDHLIATRVKGSGGFGLLLAITLDGVPENLALGVALIGADPMEVAALAGSIVLSNLPEAAGGAKEMLGGGRSKRSAFGLWIGTAVLLSASALVGNLVFADAGDSALAGVRSFAAGAVVASLATEIFPKAHKMDHHQAGVAVAVGLLLAYALAQLGG